MGQSSGDHQGEQFQFSLQFLSGLLSIVMKPVKTIKKPVKSVINSPNDFGDLVKFGSLFSLESIYLHRSSSLHVTSKLSVQ